MTTVYIRHIRAANLCASGARDWFRHYGFDWSDFLTNGKPAEELDATGDAMALKVTAIAREEEADERRRGR